MYQRILVALDGSQTAELAINHARALATKFGSTIHLVRAVHTLGELAQVATPALSTANFSQDVISRQSEAAEQATAREYLDTVRKDLEAAGIRVETRVRPGTPAQQILEAARASAADVIVLTAFGAGGAHTRSERAVFGGVADEVLRQSRVPVLLVRP